MAEAALGIGWSVERLQTEDLNAILIAVRGHDKIMTSIMRRAIVEAFTGTGANAVPDRPKTPVGGGGKPVVLTPNVFDTLFGEGKTKH